MCLLVHFSNLKTHNREQNRGQINRIIEVNLALKFWHIFHVSILLMGLSLLIICLLQNIIVYLVHTGTVRCWFSWASKIIKRYYCFSKPNKAMLYAHTILLTTLVGFNTLEILSFWKRFTIFKEKGIRATFILFKVVWWAVSAID